MEEIKVDIEKFKNPDKFPEYQTEERCYIVIGMNPYFIGSLKNPSEELCIHAVRKSGSALSFIDEEFQTESVCLIAINENPYCLKFVVNQTPEVCIEALKLDWCHFIYDFIRIPIEGKLLREINRLKLLNGPMK